MPSFVFQNQYNRCSYFDTTVVNGLGSPGKLYKRQRVPFEGLLICSNVQGTQEPNIASPARPLRDPKKAIAKLCVHEWVNKKEFLIVWHGPYNNSFKRRHKVQVIRVCLPPKTVQYKTRHIFHTTKALVLLMTNRMISHPTSHRKPSPNSKHGNKVFSPKEPHRPLSSHTMAPDCTSEAKTPRVQQLPCSRYHCQDAAETPNMV